jgi:hypothetical protein
MLTLTPASALPVESLTAPEMETCAALSGGHEQQISRTNEIVNTMDRNISRLLLIGSSSNK